VRRFEKQELRGFDDRDSGAVYEDVEFHKCVFDDFVLSCTRQPPLRTTFRRILVSDCSVRSGALFSAVVEDSAVVNLKVRGLFQAWAAVFRHVTLRGRVGRLMLSDIPFPFREDVEAEGAFREANARFYETTDWALDITEAEFEELDIRGIPARQIRRDPVTQVVVTREKAMQGAWRSLDLSRSHVDAWIKGMLAEGYPDVVIAAPKRHRNFRHVVEDLQRLRDIGVAELD
jgi:hypothetical protein